ncbi:MAG: hypothetical protein JW850_18815, partial [Thermoflexales bacterium]|nr:hypothetical protein [Thermoflexales bacterium]
MKNLSSFIRSLTSKLVPFTPTPAVATVGNTRKLDQSPFYFFSSDDRDKVEVTRRRRDDSSSGKRERAEAPSRRREDSAAPPTPRSSGGSSIPSGGRAASGGDASLSIIAALLKIFLSLPTPLKLGVLAIGCCVGTVVLFMFLQSPTMPADLDSYGVPSTSAPADWIEPATATPRPALPTRTPRPAGAPSSGDKWLVMLYQDATDKTLDHDIYLDLNEAELIGSTEQVQIVSQIKRYQGRGQSSSAWPTTKRFYVTRDDDLYTVNSQEVADVGRVNMADPNTLIDFATWAIQTYPADKHVLILSDHGMGWPGGWSDPAASGSGNARIPMVSQIGNLMYLNDIDKALEQIRARTGLDKFELIGMDACLMSQVEVVTALASHGRYAVLSEETEPALGWAYTSFLDTLVGNPDVTGAELAQSIVQTYIVDDQRIVDERARAEMTGRGSLMGGIFGASAVPSAAQLAQQLGQDVTLSAIDLQAVPALLEGLNNYAFTLQKADQRAIAQARSYAQSYTSIFGESVPPSYIDLGNFLQLLYRSVSEPAVAQAAQQLASSIEAAVIAEKHGPAKPGSTGLAIYFPNSQLYKNSVTGAESYTAIADRFARESLWDDFLAYFYTGKRFTQAAGAVAVPARGTTIVAPAAGQIQVSSVTASGQAVAPGQTVRLSVDIDGQNVGYVKLFAGFLDQAANSLYVADEDYVQSSDTQQMSGVYYPVWPESGRFTIEFEWEPIVFAINDGTQSVVARFSPETYGASSADAVYSVAGIYTFADGSGTRAARLYFRDKLLRQV